MHLRHKIDALKSQSASQWLNQANEYLPNALMWLFLLAIAWYLARLVWTIFYLNTEFDWSARPAYISKALPTGDSGQIDFPAIASTHLFGQAGAEPLTTAIDAPETQLNLQLRGAVAAGDEALAHAIIADGSGKDQVYFINDAVPGGALLHEVYADHVMLDRAGVLEALRLPRVSESLGGQALPNAMPSFSEDGADPGAMQQMMQADPSSFSPIYFDHSLICPMAS